MSGIHAYKYNMAYDFSLFGFYRPTREFFTHMDMSPLLVKGCKCSALMAIEQ